VAIGKRKERSTEHLSVPVDDKVLAARRLDGNDLNAHFWRRCPAASFSPASSNKPVAEAASSSPQRFRLTAMALPTHSGSTVRICGEENSYYDGPAFMSARARDAKRKRERDVD
jgi:hypothetical protein